MVRTSQTHPLRIDSLSVPGCDGRIGLTFCPRKKQANALTGAWDRDLQSDQREIRSWGAEVLVTLMEAHERDALGVPNLGSQAERIGLEWLYLPIVDVGTPDETFESQWKTIGTRLRLLLGSGGRVLLNCKGGLGRTGTIAARMLVESGMEPLEAIAAVRKARPNTIETNAQERYIFQLC